VGFVLTTIFVPISKNILFESIIVAVIDGVVTVTYGNSAHAELAGKTLLLTPNNRAAGSVQWICGSGTIPDKHLPSACRN